MYFGEAHELRVCGSGSSEVALGAYIEACMDQNGRVRETQMSLWPLFSCVLLNPQLPLKYRCPIFFNVLDLLTST